LLAELLSERGQGRGGVGAGLAVDEGAAAGVFQAGELGVEGGLADAQCLCGLADADVLGDDQQALEALLGVAPGEGAAERLGDVTGW
jgi:hypothetical protein